jgi:predicted acylesterase/phospholipase RssA
MTRTSKEAQRLLIVWIMAFLAGALSGCGPSLSHTVPDDLLRRLPKSSRRAEFQAKTVVTIAVDRRSTVKREIKTALNEISRTRDKIRKAKEQKGKVGAREADKIDLQIDMLGSKVDYLHDVVDHHRVRQKLAEMELVLAEAQYELSKVRLVKSNNISFDGDEEDFIDQVKSIQEDVDEFRKEVEADAADLKRLEEQWNAVKKKYYSSIGESSKGWWTE